MSDEELDDLIEFLSNRISTFQEHRTLDYRLGSIDAYAAVWGFLNRQLAERERQQSSFRG